VHRVGHWLRLY